MHFKYTYRETSFSHQIGVTGIRFTITVQTTMIWMGAQSCLTLVTTWTVAHQVPLSMGFSRQEYWSGLPFPSPGDLPDPGIEPTSPALQADSLPPESPGKPHTLLNLPAVILY